MIGIVTHILSEISHTELTCKQQTLIFIYVYHVNDMIWRKVCSCAIYMSNQSIDSVNREKPFVQIVLMIGNNLMILSIEKILLDYI